MSEKDALNYAQQVGAQHYHTSAKLNKGLDEVFVDLASKMMMNKGAKAGAAGGAAAGSPGKLKLDQCGLEGGVGVAMYCPSSANAT